MFDAWTRGWGAAIKNGMKSKTGTRFIITITTDYYLKVAPDSRECECQTLSNLATSWKKEEEKKKKKKRRKKQLEKRKKGDSLGDFLGVRVGPSTIVPPPRYFFISLALSIASLRDCDQNPERKRERKREKDKENKRKNSKLTRRRVLTKKWHRKAYYDHN